MPSINRDLPSDRIPPELAIEKEPFQPEALDLALYERDPAEARESWAAGEVMVPGTENVRRFEIDNDDLAEWAMAHVASIDAELAEVTEQRRARIERIDRWAKASTARLNRHRAFFAEHLIEYARARRDENPKRNRTLSLPSGSVKSTERKAAVKVGDEAAVAEWSVRAGLESVAEFRPKVFVRELRKHARVERQQIGWILDLSCGHSPEIPVADENGEPFDVDGPTFPCPICDDGSSSDVLTIESVVRDVAIDGDGKVIPGAEVEPGRIDYTVTT